jgi:hypothetical protein
MNAMLQDECCAEADTIPSPALVLIGTLSPCTWVGFLPDGTLRPNGWELAWAEAHWDNAERDKARLESRLRYAGVVIVSVWFVGVLCGGWAAGVVKAVAL